MLSKESKVTKAGVSGTHNGGWGDEKGGERGDGWRCSIVIDDRTHQDWNLYSLERT